MKQPLMDFHRFAGVALAGGKTDKTAVAVLEYYPDQRRIFLRSLRDKIKGDEEFSADWYLHEILSQEETGLTTVAFDVPLQLPSCITCVVKCPGAERCKLPQVKWMQDVHKNRGKHKRPNKLFTPYTERCAEVYISTMLEEPFHPSHALGSNAAPLTARAHFIRRRLSAKIKTIETYPKLSLWRIGRSLKVGKSYLRFHKHAVDGDEARLVFLKSLIDHQIAFIYQQDMKAMVENGAAFDAFIAALTAFLKFRGQCEKAPAGYPKNEAWIDFPKEEIDWF